MHELSIALEVGRMAEEHVARAQLPQIVEVGLEVGDQAGIEVDNLQFCLEAVFSTPPFTGAKPVIERLHGDILRLSYLEVDDERPNH
jgi:Zn finger protein HypA/HybF involved in hydrogenase expression